MPAQLSGLTDLLGCYCEPALQPASQPANQTRGPMEFQSGPYGLMGLTGGTRGPMGYPAEPSTSVDPAAQFLIQF